MFNKTEMLQLELGRNDRWQDKAGGGFTSGSSVEGGLRTRRSNAIRGGRSISQSNRKAAMKAARLLES